MARYQASIDGLRAVSVLAVLAYHLDDRYLPGGFAGVDVFFTISGYLIGQMVLREVEEGRFSFAGFYQRRIARLAPTFAVVSFGTLAAALLVYSQQDAATVGARLVYAALGVANIKEAQGAGYFAASRDAQPLLHYWSLAVEEQFYVLLPLLLVAARSWQRGVRIAVLAMLMLASLGAAVFFTGARPTWAFYLLPTRAWELLAGVLLAAFGERRASPAVVGWLGLAMVCASFVLVESSAGFPGFQALMPVLGTVLLIHGVASDERSALARWLGGSPLAALGRASYALYMVHWPVFSFVAYYAFRASPGARLAAQLALTAVLTWLVHRAFERPARTYLREPRRRVIAYVALAAIVALGVALGTHVRETRLIHSRPDMPARILNASARGGDLVLLGDSFAMMYGTALREVAEARDLRLHAYAYPDYALLTPGDPLWRTIIGELPAVKPKVIVLALRWRTALHDDPTRLVRAVEQLEPLCQRLVVLTQPPFRPPAATREGIRRGARAPFWEHAELRDVRRGADAHVRALGARDVSVIDVEALLTSPDGSLRAFDDAGRELYFDDHHLADSGARIVAAAITEVLDQPAK